jgi:unsaturated rhamnogalacturonyl hydrolase
MIAPSEQLRSLVHRAADCLLSYPWKVWFWGDSIGLEGLLDASALAGDPKYLHYVHGLLKGWAARERHRGEFDYTAPGVALLRVYECTGDRTLLDAARRHAEYMAGFRTTVAGAYVRYENAAIELPPVLPDDHPDAEALAGRSAVVAGGGPCVFVDCVHFDGPFFAKLFQLTGERWYRDLAVANILSQIELLYDPRERLFHHFWMERTGRRNGVTWGRGNGWGLLGVVLTLEFLGGSDEAAPRLRHVLRDSLERLAALQHPSGAWHTILTDPASYTESSTAAFFADVICRAACLGIVSRSAYDEVLERAMTYLMAHVRADGVLEGVSYETFPSTRPGHYRQMPLGALVPWGQGPLLAALRSHAQADELREDLPNVAAAHRL